MKFGFYGSGETFSGDSTANAGGISKAVATGECVGGTYNSGVRCIMKYHAPYDGFEGLLVFVFMHELQKVFPSF